MDSTFISLPPLEGTFATESDIFLGFGGKACTMEPPSGLFDCCECWEVLLALEGVLLATLDGVLLTALEGVLLASLEGVLLAILLEAASERCGGTLPKWLPLLLEASASASSSPRLRFFISYYHSLLRFTVISRLSWKTVQVKVDSDLKSSLNVSTRRILSQFQSSSVVGRISTSGVNSSSLSQSIRMAREMYRSGCFSLRRTAQQESMLRTPPQTIFRNLTWQVEERLIIFQNRSGLPGSHLPSKQHNHPIGSLQGLSAKGRWV